MNLSTRERASRIAGAATLLLTATTLAMPAARAQESFIDVMGFAADMAKEGNWREARFRWELADRKWPNHRKILNNLAVASEAIGDLDAARAYYRRALEAGHDESIEANYNRSARFWSRVGQLDVEDIPPESPAAKSKKKIKGKTMKVTVMLPVPARLDTSGVESMLVASFLTEESAMIDINREFVRFLRSEFRKNVDFEVLPVTPAPAVPEQNIEDLIANREFWKYLGREYAADLIVSGVLRYERRDASGFRDVDVVSPTTGQKVRQSQFVEQEEFTQGIDMIFMDGNSGELRYRDRMQRVAVFGGSQNDPITAFYELSDAIAPDILAIVRPRRREDLRFIFRK